MISFKIIFFSAFLLLNTCSCVFAQDTILPSQHKFYDKTVFTPKLSDENKLINTYMDYLKAGKKTIGFVHEDELEMIPEKKLTEKKLFITDYQVISVTKREAVVKVVSAKGAILSCKLLTLRYYKNMHGFYYLVPGKIETFEKKLGDITLKEVYINTWTQEKSCN